MCLFYLWPFSVFCTCAVFSNLISLLFTIPVLIAEVILYSEGFESSKKLAKKMTQMYKLCSEQLSQQDHYDFGMRAVKSVLVMAGALKRQNPDKQEDVVLIRALRDSNLPKFLMQDALLFQVCICEVVVVDDIPPRVHFLANVCKRFTGVISSLILSPVEQRLLMPHVVSCGYAYSLFNAVYL